jgi:hypothetical protein
LRIFFLRVIPGQYRIDLKDNPSFDKQSLNESIVDCKITQEKSLDGHWILKDGSWSRDLGSSDRQWSCCRHEITFFEAWHVALTKHHLLLHNRAGRGEEDVLKTELYTQSDIRDEKWMGVVARSSNPGSPAKLE